MKMYRTKSYGCEIHEVEVEKKSEKSVWINGHRNAIKSDWNQYHDSFDDAKKYLIEKAERKIETEKFHLECAESFLEKVMSQEKAVVK